MISNLIVTNGELLAHPKLEADDRLTVEPSEDNLLFFITVIHLHPHPLGLPGVAILKFNLDVITTLI